MRGIGAREEPEHQGVDAGSESGRALPGRVSDGGDGGGLRMIGFVLKEKLMKESTDQKWGQKVALQASFVGRGLKPESG